MGNQFALEIQLPVARNKRFRKHKFIYFRFVAFFFLSVCCLLTVQAQVESQLNAAPPPLKILSKSEKSQLEAETNVKQHTKLALELMDARLLNAENLNAREEYAEMFTELGSFHALVDNTLNFLQTKDTDSGRVLNNFKRIEMSLRKFITRLELIRRDLPVKYEFYVRSLVKYMRTARTKAVEPLFDNTVLPNNKE